MTTLLAQVGRYGFDHMSGWGWGAAIFGWVLMIALFALIVWLVVAVTRGQQPAAPAGKRALDLLDEGYARGEIERDEYLQRKADLAR